MTIAASRKPKALPPFLMKASQSSRADGASTNPSRTISNIPTSRPTSPWQSQGPGADTLLLACRQKTHGSHVDWTEWGGSHHPPSTVDLSKHYTRHARVSLSAGTQLDRRLGHAGGVTALGDGHASPSRYPSPKRYPSPTVRFADRRARATAAPSSPPSRDNIGRLQTMIADDHRQLSVCSRALRRWAEAAATKPTRVRWLAEGWLPPGAGRRAALFARWRCRTSARAALRALETRGMAPRHYFQRARCAHAWRVWREGAAAEAAAAAAAPAAAAMVAAMEAAAVEAAAAAARGSSAIGGGATLTLTLTLSLTLTPSPNPYPYPNLNPMQATLRVAVAPAVWVTVAVTQAAATELT